MKPAHTSIPSVGVGAHLDAVPFENGDTAARVPVALDVGAAWAKVVARHRGGFCFELNLLFAWLLLRLGFDARVGASGDLEIHLPPREEVDAVLATPKLKVTCDKAPKQAPAFAR